jgi:transketolase
MRNAFADEITKLAGKDERIVLLPGDIGNRLFDNYKGKFPDRFYNCGVAEANLVSMAAGMALCGLRPIGYTITPFITSRCFEQIRVDVCYNNLPVVTVAVGSGFGYASLGATHHSCEDIAIMRVIPNMTVICPGDAFEVRAAIRAALKHDGPVYLRIGKKNEPLVHKDVPEFEIGKGIIIHEGNDVCLLSTGNMLPIAVEAGKKLSNQGTSTQVVSLHTVKPLDAELLSKIFEKFKLIVTIEEHSLLGGLGSAVSEWLVDNISDKAKLLRIGTNDVFLHKVGEQEYARKQFGLTAEAITKKVLDNYNK